MSFRQLQVQPPSERHQGLPGAREAQEFYDGVVRNPMNRLGRGIMLKVMRRCKGIGAEHRGI